MPSEKDIAETWRSRSDVELLAAAENIDDFWEAARGAILDELRWRGLEGNAESVAVETEADGVVEGPDLKRIEWQQKQRVEEELRLTCPACGELRVLPAHSFADDRKSPPDRVTPTGKVVTSCGIGGMFPIIVALVVYYLVHRALFGAEASLIQGMLVPALAAALGFGISGVFWSLICAWLGRKLPVNEVLCQQCEGAFYLATDGKVWAAGTASEEGPSALGDSTL